MAEARPISFVAFLTTGPSPEQDGVLEVAAVRRQGGEELARFAQLANPGELPLAVQKLTGLDPTRVAGRPAPRKVLKELTGFLGDDPVVIHDAPAMAGFMAAEGFDMPPEMLDSLALARAALPSERDHSLPALAGALGVEPPAMHRALEMSLTLAAVWERLLGELKALPGAVLDALHRIAAAAESPLSAVLSEAANDVAGFKLSSEDAPALGEFLRDYRELFATAQKYEAPEPRDDPLETDKICAMFTTGGAIGRHLPGYEQRDEQVGMVRAVCDALSDGTHLLCEAGTGTGKSMAYLAPAIAWARQNEDKVIISTNTRNLQEQLYHKDLPFLHELLGGRFEAALLKGRRNYLCVRRFMQLLRYFEHELEPDEMTALLPVVVWSGRTQSGDVSECTGLLKNENFRAVLDRVTSAGDDCMGRACRMRSRCFVQRARTLAQLADLVVVNHALLFSDVGMDQPVLPPYQCVVFDEAQNVEDVATEAMAVGVDSLSVFRITNRLWRQRRRDGAGSGLIAGVLHEADRRLKDGEGETREAVIASAQQVIEKIGPVVQLTKDCMQTLARPFDVLPAREDKIMMEECEPKVGPDSPTGLAAGELADAVQGLRVSIEELAVCLAKHEEELPNAAGLCADLRAQAGRLGEVVDQIRFVQAQDETNFVYWIERTRRGRQEFHGMHAAPLEIGKFIKQQFFDTKRSVIMTSATLRVGGEFSYMQERLGAELGEERIQCMAVGSPFDFDRQTMVAVPTFLPDAGGRREEGYDDQLSSLLIDLFTATGGRGLVLCTSYSLLNALHENVKRPLEQIGIPVLAQGRDGSREAISATFRRVTSSVLLGTQSFWEGVDFTGETLSCLVVTKLPFHVVTEPLVQGRIQYLQNMGLAPFTHYTLPEAVISFRQGFGRLIRNRTDRGVVVVTDRRLVTKGYGRSFTSDLPTGCRVFKEQEALISGVKRFFARA